MDSSGPGPRLARLARLGVTPLGLFTALAFLVNVDTRMISPLLPTMAASLGTTVSAIGLAVTAYLLPYGCFQLVYGPLADRLGGIRVVRVVAFGFGLGTLAMGWATSVAFLIVLRFLTGVFAAAIIPLTLVHIGESVPYAERQGAIGRYVAIVSIAQSVSAALGGTIAQFVSWRGLFVVVGIASIVPAALFYLGPPPRPPAAAKGGWERYAIVLRHRAARVLYVVVGFEGLFLWGGFTYVGAVAVARFDLDPLHVGLLVSLYGVATLIGGIFLRRVRRVIPESALAAAGGGLKGGAYFLMIPRGSIVLYVIALLLLGFGYVALHTTLQTRATELVPEARGTAVALFAFFLFLGASLGAALFGPLVDHGWHRTFLLICGTSLVALGGAVVGVLGPHPSLR
jgi:predicted MFS family arabinose efflux permease